jgi:hypothetical protein
MAFFQSRFVVELSRIKWVLSNPQFYLILALESSGIESELRNP